MLGLAARIGQSDPAHPNTQNSFEYVSNIRREPRSCPTDLDRSGGASQPRHGPASESGPVSDPGYPRSRVDGDDLHACRRDTEYRLGPIASPIGALADRLGLRVMLLGGAAISAVGLAVMATAGGVTSLILSGALIGVALSCTASSLAMTACARAVSKSAAARSWARLGRGIARHIDDPDDHAIDPGTPFLADRRIVLRCAGGGDASSRLPRRRRGSNARRRGNSDDDARFSGKRHGIAPSW